MIEFSDTRIPLCIHTRDKRDNMGPRLISSKRSDFFLEVFPLSSALVLRYNSDRLDWMAYTISLGRIHSRIFARSECLAAGLQGWEYMPGMFWQRRGGSIISWVLSEASPLPSVQNDRITRSCLNLRSTGWPQTSWEQRQGSMASHLACDDCCLTMQQVLGDRGSGRGREFDFLPAAESTATWVCDLGGR